MTSQRSPEPSLIDGRRARRSWIRRRRGGRGHVRGRRPRSDDRRRPASASARHPRRPHPARAAARRPFAEGITARKMVYAARLARDDDDAAERADRAERHRQAETRGLLVAARREERIEDARQDVSWDPHAVVAHLDDGVAGGVGVGRDADLVGPLVAALGDRLRGVDHQIQDRVPELGLVGLDRRDLREGAHQAGARLDLVKRHLDARLDHAAEVDQRAGLDGIPRKNEEVSHGLVYLAHPVERLEKRLEETGETLDRLLRPRTLDPRGALRKDDAQLAQHVLDVDRRRRERCVELMRCSGGERGDGSETIGEDGLVEADGHGGRAPDHGTSVARASRRGRRHRFAGSGHGSKQTWRRKARATRCALDHEVGEMPDSGGAPWETSRPFPPRVVAPLQSILARRSLRGEALGPGSAMLGTRRDQAEPRPAASPTLEP